MSFKVGEKVVYIGSLNPELAHPSFRFPERINIVVTIHALCDTYPGYYEIVEYLYAHNGRVQSFDGRTLRKLSEVSSELSSEILEKITEEIKEPELCPQ